MPALPSVINQGGITPAREAEAFIDDLLRDATPDELETLKSAPGLVNFVDREFTRRRVEGVDTSVLPPAGAAAPNPPFPRISNRTNFSLDGRPLPPAVGARGLDTPASQRLNLSPQAEIDPVVDIANGFGTQTTNTKPPTQVVGGNVPSVVQPLASVVPSGSLAAPVGAATPPSAVTDSAPGKGVAPQPAGGELGAILPQSGGQKVPTTQSEILKFLSQPETTAALLQFAINVLQPLAPGQTTIGAIASAFGAGAQAAGRVTSKRLASEKGLREEGREDRRLDTADRRVDVAEEQLGVQREGLDVERDRNVITAARDAAVDAAKNADRKFDKKKFRQEMAFSISSALTTAKAKGAELSVKQRKAFATSVKDFFKVRIDALVGGTEFGESLPPSAINKARDAAIRDAQNAFGLPVDEINTGLSQAELNEINEAVAGSGVEDTVAQLVAENPGMTEAKALALVQQAQASVGIQPSQTAPGKVPDQSTTAPTAPADPDVANILDVTKNKPSAGKTSGATAGIAGFEPTTDEERAAEVFAKLPATFEEKPEEFWRELVERDSKPVRDAIAAKFPQEFKRILTQIKTEAVARQRAKVR